MKPSPLAFNRFRRLSHIRSRRGSAILLVLVSLVLMAILGATYLQVTRFERMSAAEEENIDVVLEDILKNIALKLGQDLFADNGNLFDPNAGIEPYDYHWIDPAENKVSTASAVTGTPIDHYEETLDDGWLATLTANTAGDQWPQISNLLGYFVDGVGDSATLTELPWQRSQQIDQTAADIATVDESIYADADADGKADSRWAYATLPQVGGTQYVMGIRIIDLSAKLNVGTASSLMDFSGAPTRDIAKDAGRGNTPGELDLAGLVQELIANGTAPATSYSSAAALVQKRSDVAGSQSPTVYGDGTDASRYNNWRDYGARTNLSGEFSPPGVAFGSYEISDSVELLYRNGLNSAQDSFVETTSAEGEPTFLRSGSVETAPPATWSAAQFLNQNPRTWLTATSGVAMFMPPVNGTSTSYLSTINSIMKADLNFSTADELNAVIAPAMADQARAAQLAAVIADASDEDGMFNHIGGPVEITGVIQGATTYYGLEALPFLTEVYVEAPYTAGGVIEDNVPAGGDGLWSVTMSFDSAGDAVGYAIEITNPFDQPISLKGVTLHIGTEQLGGTRDLDQLIGARVATLGGADTWKGIQRGQFNGGRVLLPGDVVVIFSEGVGLDANQTGGTLESRIAAGAIGVDLDTVGGGIEWPTSPTTAQSVDVELRVNNTDGTPVTYSRFTAETVAETLSYPDDGTADGYDSSGGNNAPVADESYILAQSHQGNGKGANAMLVATAEVVAGELDTDDAFNATTFEALGEAAKTGGVPDKLSSAELATVWNRSIEYLGDIALLPILGPTSEAAGTVGDRFVAMGVTTPTTLDALALNPYAPAPGAGVDAFDVNEFVAVASRLTVLSPLNDDLDNDLNGQLDDDGEVFIAGRVNVNTVPTELLEAALPIPDDTLRNEIALAIQTARTAAGTNPGIAYVEELFNVGAIRDAFDDGADTMYWNFNAVPADDYDVNSASNEMPLDFSNFAYDPGAGVTYSVHTADNIIANDSFDERLLVAKWLSQVATTRSDTFAAYVTIRGYAVGEFNNDPIEAIRAIAIFSRANVKGAGDSANIIAVRIVE